MQILRELPLFQELPDDELTWIVEHSAEVMLATGEYYVHEGEPTDTFFIVLDGELQVTRTIDGKPAVVGTIPRGLFANELPLLNGTPAFSTICAIMPSRLRVLALQAFRGLFGACPVIRRAGAAEGGRTDAMVRRAAQATGEDGRARQTRRRPRPRAEQPGHRRAARRANADASCCRRSRRKQSGCVVWGLTRASSTRSSPCCARQALVRRRRCCPSSGATGRTS